MRQKEIRRSKAERRVPLWQRANAVVPLPTLGLGVVAAIVAAVIVGLGGDTLTLRVGQSLNRPLTARADFEIFEQAATSNKKVEAYDGSPNYYRLNASLIDDIHGRFSSAMTIAQTRPDDPEVVRAEAAKKAVLLDDEGLEELRSLAAAEDSTLYQRAIDAMASRLRNAFELPLVEATSDAMRRAASRAVLLTSDELDKGVELDMPKVWVADADAVARTAERASLEFPRKLRESARQSLVKMLTDGEKFRALYAYDAKLTATRAEAAREAVEPVYTHYAAGLVIAPAGVLTTTDYVKIQHEHAAYRKQQRAAMGFLGALGLASPSTLGRSAMTFLAALGVVGHFLLFRRSRRQPKMFRHTVAAAVLLGLLLATRAAYASSTVVPAHVALAPQVLAAALLVIVYQRPSIVVPLALTSAFVMTLAVEQDVSFFFVLFAASATMAAVLSEVRRRGQVIVAGTAAAAVAALTTMAASLINQQPLSYGAGLALWAVGATLAAAFIVEGLLPSIERMFKLSTSLTLLEWCDASKPLLRMMAAEAPGTYNHSLLVGALGEAAADAIGANGLLCRAGAYYHDIGKINKPEYFVENQAMRPNMHERLSPAMSLLIIIGHVKDGREMAKEYGLPEGLRPFIAEHHGTTLVEYFYHAASQRKGPDDRDVSDTEFRYPGPKPQTRESGVIMLCDAVEGAVRAMSEPTPNRIEDTVSAIVRKRLIDGQFDECDLTFREIAVIKSSLVKSLCAIYHSRIKYPSAEEDRSRESVQGVGA